MIRSNNPHILAWAEAVDLLREAERLRQQFFRIEPVPRPRWQPPADVFEAEDQISIYVALPGVPAEDLQVLVEGDELVVRGQRTLPRALHGATIRQLEIPYGRFERRFALSPGQYSIAERSFADGCLVIRLQRAARAQETLR